MTRFPFRAKINGQQVVVEKLNSRTFTVDGRVRYPKQKMRPSREKREWLRGHAALDEQMEAAIERDS